MDKIEASHPDLLHGSGHAGRSKQLLRDPEHPMPWITAVAHEATPEKGSEPLSSCFLVRWHSGSTSLQALSRGVV